MRSPTKGSGRLSSLLSTMSYATPEHVREIVMMPLVKRHGRSALVALVLLYMIHSFTVQKSIGGIVSEEQQQHSVSDQRSLRNSNSNHYHQVQQQPMVALISDNNGLDIRRTQEHVVTNRKSYSNMADFDGALRLFQVVQRLGMDQKELVVLVGGTHNGQASVNILDLCPTLSLYGFEIQKRHFLNSQKRLSVFPHASVLNMGWDESEQVNVPIGGQGAAGGLLDPKGQSEFMLQLETANTVALSDWTSRQMIAQVLYVVIDVGGHEPKVLRGMHLERRENQQKFPLFQVALGGTWAANHSRHQNDPWTQQDAARHLARWGYELFLIGTDDWLSINSDYFSEVDNPVLCNEGFGVFAQGNLLALHARYTPVHVQEHLYRHVREIRSNDDTDEMMA
jgi:hypothetical protein